MIDFKIPAVDPNKAINLFVLVVCILGFIAFANSIVNDSNVLKRSKVQIIAENQECIYLEPSTLAPQYYMVCSGQVMVKTLRPRVVVAPTVSVPTQTVTK